MGLCAIPDGVAVMIDANILAYHRISTPGLTSIVGSFLGRVESGDLRGFTTATLVSEAIHKIVLAEAVQQHGLPPKGVVTRLKESPHLVRSITHRTVTSDVLRAGVAVEPVTSELLVRAEEIVVLHGLLTNDSITLAAMEHLGLTDIATNDDDFDSVAGLTVWKPR